MTEIQLGLKPLSMADVDNIFTLTSNPQVTKYMRFSTHETKAETEELVKQYLAPGNHSFTIWLRMGGSPSHPGKEAFAGVLAMKKSERGEGVCDLSIFLDPDCWGKGIASQLLSWISNVAGKEYKYKSLMAWVVADNRASRKILERSGFVVAEMHGFADLPAGLYTYRLDL